MLNKIELTLESLQIKRFFSRKFDCVILSVAAIIYIILMFHLSYLKYYTFNATFYDLGVNNEVLWLLSHGFISNYTNSHFSQIYPLQYEKPIIFLVLPFYSLYPHISTLLFIQTLFLGLTVFPIYFSSRTLIGSRVVSLIVAVSFLGFFPVASTNLFDFHFMSLFPFFYLMTVMFWANRKTKLMIISAIITATINPLALILIVFFLSYSVLYDFKFTSSMSLWTFLKTHTMVLFAMVGLIVTIVMYHIFGTLYLAGATPSTKGSILFFYVNYKMELFLFLFGALAFIPLLEPMTLILIAPYAGYVILSTDSANFQIFGLFYPLFAAGPLYLGLLLGLKTLISNSSNHTEIKKRQQNLKFLNNLRIEKRAFFKPMFTFVVVVLIFSIVYFPYSPVNVDVQGGYWSGNHEINSLTNINPAIVSLHKIISLIPSNASVLTMNDIPEVSGREYVGIYNNQANISYNYILFNSYFSYFTTPNEEIPFLNKEITNESYGIVAETQYSLLLEKNYTSSPKLYIPFNYSDSSINFETCSNNIRAYGNITDNHSNTYMSYGSCATLFPGTYNFTYYISSANVSTNSSPALLLEVGAGNTIFNSKVIYRNNFTKNNNIIGFTITVTFNAITENVEFMGLFNNDLARLTIHSVYIKQLSV